VEADTVGKLEPKYLSVTKTMDSHFLKVDFKTTFIDVKLLWENKVIWNRYGSFLCCILV